MKVVIAGSRALPAGNAPRLLARFLATFDDGDTVLIRTPKTGEPGPFEQDVVKLCRLFYIPVETYTPEPTGTTPGRSSVYLRDIELVAASDLVLLFFKPDEAVEGYSGTAHLMDKALDGDRPVYAYTVADDGRVARVGEYDPSDLFIGKVPVV
jgi:hypothetical protein